MNKYVTDNKESTNSTYTTTNIIRGFSSPVLEEKKPDAFPILFRVHWFIGGKKLNLL